MFRYIQALFKSIFTQIQNLSYPSDIQNPGISYHIAYLDSTYIHNNILNIFSKSSIFDVWYSSEYASLL